MTPVDIDKLKELVDDAVSTLAAIRATTISGDEWEASRLHFRELCGDTIARMNAARNALSPKESEK